MAMCYKKHPFEIENEDRLSAINSKIFEIKKKIQLSEGQRKSNFEENEAEKQENQELISTLKREVRNRLQELARARASIGEDEVAIKRYLNQVCPVGNKSVDQIIHNLDLKVIEQRKSLDLLKYETKSKKSMLKQLEKEYEHLLIEDSKSATEKIKSKDYVKKHSSHMENEIHKVLVQWSEAELVKKKYTAIRSSLLDDAVKFESSLAHVGEMLARQAAEVAKLEAIQAAAQQTRLRATAALLAAGARAQGAERDRESEREYFAERFDERRRELEKLEKRIFPPTARAPVVRQDSAASAEAAPAPEEEASELVLMENTFQKLMKLTGVTEADAVWERFRGQRETCRRLGVLQAATEQEKLALETSQTQLMAELEAYKFAEVKDSDEAQDQIAELKEQISSTVSARAALQARRRELDDFLLEIKKLLHDLAKMLDMIPEPPLPPWCGDPRFVRAVAAALAGRYARAADRVSDVRAKWGGVTPAMPSNPPSASASAAVSALTTPREPEPGLKDLVGKEPRPPQSEEEEDIPSRSYLKRQAQLIVDTKSRRKGFRPPYPRK